MELAAFSAEDVTAILDTLEEERRDIVSGLLQTYAEPLDGGRRGAAVPASFDARRLSPWLLDRLSVDRSTDLAITPHSRQALHNRATRLFRFEGASPETAAAPRPSLVHRIGACFSAKAMP